MRLSDHATAKPIEPILANYLTVLLVRYNLGVNRWFRCQILDTYIGNYLVNIG